MKNRRLSYGLLLTIAAALAGCGSDPPPAADSPANTSAPEAPSAAAEAPPPPAPEPKKEEPPPPPPAKPAKDRFVGKFQQDFAGDVKDAGSAAALQAAGKDKDGNPKDKKKYDAALAKAQAATADNTLVNTADVLEWDLKGKPLHKIHYEATGTDTTLSLKLGKDDQAKKDLKGMPVDVTFSDENTFSVKDPFAPGGKGKTLVFKRQ